VRCWTMNLARRLRKVSTMKASPGPRNHSSVEPHHWKSTLGKSVLQGLTRVQDCAILSMRSDKAA